MIYNWEIVFFLAAGLNLPTPRKCVIYSWLDPPRKARARSPNLQRTGLIGSVTSRDVTKSVNVVLARWFHFFDAKPKNVHFWCPKVGSRYRPLEWLIQLTSIFFRVPPNLSVKLPRDSNAVHPHRCCTGKVIIIWSRREEHKITSCSFCAVRRKERFAQKMLFSIFKISKN